ncbi:DEAD/DEAH box helicase family protein [Vibrio sp. B181a]|uniref:DEAD/DEAH box helicase family protein n=1 Tax=Vibrio sp. B181a TaxID=2835906 RepID=UPI002555FF72|nr:DEAD/DEAH box helicase family protein [Vibrio sp. B181a]MDK9771803.1 DEAD/DEAH box helicase family protein [Vibrio sp. B181a]
MSTSLNFELIREHNEKLANLGHLAEQILHLDPGSAITRLRGFAEEVTKEIYSIDGLPRLPQATFMELLKNDAFVEVTESRLRDQLHFLRIEGNETAHGGDGNVRKAYAALGTAHSLSQYMAINYYGFQVSDLQELKYPESALSSNLSQKQLEKVVEENEKQQEALLKELERERQAREAAESKAERTQEQLKQAKARSQQTANSLEWDEDKTRQLLIDTQLAQAGWDINDKESVGIEVEVKHQPTATGIGYADYVLWNDDGTPLAVVEAKRAREHLQKGREQARYYAEGLAKQFDCAVPIVFYTNGYEICIWDTKQYNTYRQIFGFYSKESLQFLQYQHQYKEPNLEVLNPNVDIAGRPYQIEAIKAVTSQLQNQRRKALIVQATGTGKTRVSIALVELLLRSRWVKRVLFLCDRKELRRQADGAFKDYLPTEPRCVIGEKNQIDTSARVFVSTYPGMMNRFSQLDVGFFDLIIADESHRSIYNRYRDIFDYFDAIQVGLTATPVKFIARNTYDLFGCENGDPTFNFDLAEAISHEPRYLNPFRVKEFTTEFLRDGIHYSKLTPEQQAQLEEDLGEEEAQKTTIKGKDIGKKIFSVETDSAILENLIENGIKDATNSLVGKTIIFAQNQAHAEQLEKLFCEELYPQYGSKVCKVIHNKVDRPEARIDEFKNPNNDFRIAISVDMMDTGIDVPEVVNLVFARPVKSWVKFWQMIGRGTRLCPDLFGPGQDKEEFLIFDHYGNFAYFEEEYVEADTGQSRSLLQTLFEARLELADEAMKKADVAAFELACAQMKADICDLPDGAIAVRRELRTVKQLQETDMLLEMNGSTRHILETKMAPLMGSRTLKDKDASMLDRLMAQVEKANLTGSSDIENLKVDLISRLQNLAVNITDVRKQGDEIAKVQTQQYWDSLSIEQLETTRRNLRGIMKYKKRETSVYDATPTTRAGDGDVIENDRVVVIGDESEAMVYRKRIKDILETMLANNSVLQKIHQNQPVTEEELKSLTSTILTQHPGVDVNALNAFYGNTPEQLSETLIQLVGLDAELVNERFTEFMQTHQLSYIQVQFLNQLKGFICRHGRIKMANLYEGQFDKLTNGEGLDIFNDATADQLEALIEPFLLPH